MKSTHVLDSIFSPFPYPLSLALSWAFRFFPFHRLLTPRETFSVQLHPQSCFPNSFLSLIKLARKMVSTWCFPSTTCLFSIPVELLSWSSAMNFKGSLSLYSPWFLWSKEYDTVDRLPLLLKLFILLLYYNTSFFSSISNVYSSFTFLLNLGAPEKLIIHYRHTYRPHVIVFRTFCNPATFLFYFSTTLPHYTNPDSQPNRILVNVWGIQTCKPHLRKKYW